MRLMRRPRASSRQPIDAAARPLPSEDTTPPVTKMYFADIAATSSVLNLGCAGWARPSISCLFLIYTAHEPRLLFARRTGAHAGLPATPRAAVKAPATPHHWPARRAVRAL